METVGLGEFQIEEAPCKPFPERRDAFGFLIAAQLGEHLCGEALAVQRHEQIAAAREQHAEARAPQVRHQEQPAHLARPGEIVHEIEHVGRDDSLQLAAILGEPRDLVAVEGLLGADAGEDERRARDAAALAILQHEQVKLVIRR